MTHPYFKLRWLPAQLADQQSRLKYLFIAAARDMSAALPIKMQLFQLTVKTPMMTILHSPTLLTRKHHKRHQIQQTTSVTWKCCSFLMIARRLWKC